MLNFLFKTKYPYASKFWYQTNMLSHHGAQFKIFGNALWAAVQPFYILKLR